MLTVRLFGTVQVDREHEGAATFPTEKSKSLFSYLILKQPRRYSREALATILWQEQSGSKALRCLRTELWRMRRVVEPDDGQACNYLRIGRKEVGFNADSGHWLDVHHFEDKLSPLASKSGYQLSIDEARSVKDAVEIYKGDLLEDIYDDWPIIERERFRELFINGLEQLTLYHEKRGDWPEAIAYAWRLLNTDSLREHVHRQLIRYHYARGDRPAALQQYAMCCRLLRREFGVEPMEETRELSRRISRQDSIDEILSDQSSSASGSINTGVQSERKESVSWPMASARGGFERNQGANRGQIGQALERMAEAEREISEASQLLKHLTQSRGHSGES